VKIQFPLVGLIILAMHDKTLCADRALRAGARGYVMKREASKSVLASIRRVLEGGVYVSEKIISRLVQGPGVSRQAPVTSPVERLSDRELEIFRLLGQGRTTAQIAADMKLSLKTVQTHYTRAKEKLGVSSLTELLCAAVRWEDSSHIK
jgi:DNA-binding NarL/FixJ family response regulator